MGDKTEETVVSGCPTNLASNPAGIRKGRAPASVAKKDFGMLYRRRLHSIKRRSNAGYGCTYTRRDETMPLKVACITASEGMRRGRGPHVAIITAYIS